MDTNLHPESNDVSVIHNDTINLSEVDSKSLAVEELKLEEAETEEKDDKHRKKKKKSKERERDKDDKDRDRHREKEKDRTHSKDRPRDDKDKDRPRDDKDRDRPRDDKDRDRPKDNKDRPRDDKDRDRPRDDKESDRPRENKDRPRDNRDRDRPRDDRERDRNREKDRDEKESSRRARDRSKERTSKNKDDKQDPKEKEIKSVDNITVKPIDPEDKKDKEQQPQPASATARKVDNSRDRRDRYRDDRNYNHRDRDHRDYRDRDRRRRSPSPPRRRRRSPSAHSNSSNERRNRRRRDKSPDKKTDTDDSKIKPVSLKDIIAANPGISLPEAVNRLNAYNTAVANGLIPDALNGNLASVVANGVLGIGTGGITSFSTISNSMLPSAAASAIAAVSAAAMGNMGVQGEGGAVTKPHRELYIGNLPPAITVPQLAEFMNTTFKQFGISTQNTVVTAWVSPDGHYAFVEVRTIEEANAALTYLNGIQVGAYSLKIGRPKGYAGGNIAAITAPMMTSGGLTTNPLTGLLPGGGNGGSGLGIGGLGSSNPLLAGLNSGVSSVGGMGMTGLPSSLSTETLSNVIMVTNLPALISEEQIRELFVAFGELKAFNIIKTASGQTQSAVFEYVIPELTDGVVAGMNKLEIADHRISVQRIPASSAVVLLQPTPLTTAAVTSIATNTTTIDQYPSPTNSPCNVTKPNILASMSPTTVIRLSNMTTYQDLIDDELYEELLEDVADECNSHGTVKSIIIPREGTAESIHSDNEATGKIFIQFVDIDGAQKSLNAIAGRKFNGRVVEAYFYPEDLYSKQIYVVPTNYFDSLETNIIEDNIEQQQHVMNTIEAKLVMTENIEDLD